MNPEHRIFAAASIFVFFGTVKHHPKTGIFLVILFWLLAKIRVAIHYTVEGFFRVRRKNERRAPTSRTSATSAAPASRTSTRWPIFPVA